MHRAIKVTLMCDRESGSLVCTYPTDRDIAEADLLKPFVFSQAILAGMPLLTWKN